MKFMFTKVTAVLVLAWGLSAAALAQPVANGGGSDELFSVFFTTADRIRADIDRGTLSNAELETQRALLEVERKNFSALANNAATEKAPLTRQLEALGPEPEEGEEAEDLAADRVRLTAAIAEVDARQRRAEQAAERAQALLDELNNLRRARFEEQLFTRGPSPISADRVGRTISALDQQRRAVLVETDLRLAQSSSVMGFVDRVALPVILSLLGLFLAVALRRWLIARLERSLEKDKTGKRIAFVAVGVTIARLLLPAIAVGLVYVGIVGSNLVGPTGILIVQGVADGFLTVIGAFALGSAFFAPRNSELRLSQLADADASAAARWLMALAAVVALDSALVVTGEEIGLNVDALAVFNAGVLILGGIALWQFVGSAHIGVSRADQDADGPGDDTDDQGDGAAQHPLTPVLRLIRILTRTVAILAPLLALAGYYGASRFMFYPLVYSGALIGLGMVFQRVVRELSFATLSDVGHEGQEKTASGIPVLTGFLLVFAALPLLALIWGATTTDLAWFWGRMVDGFAVGDVVISPFDFVLFVIVFAIGYVLTRLVQGILRRSVMPVLRMDAGAKSALTAGVGYVGLVIAALIAISTTGLDLSNLAIVAGALSVGIGFGLQNIVNNFVSGIILLVERPIKTGDWVEIAGVHGTVQKVNVRSTEIQTFDRSTMFVPNADLISGTVTNWTHSNNHGRLIVAVGVAYGSDVRKVEKILLEVAQGHPMLMRRPGAYVIFTGFGADSLDFEIRGVLRDVNWILNVASDIRFAVYERFEQEGIEIPFAQRDVHIRTLGPLEDLVTQKAPLKKPEGKAEDTPNAEDGGGSGG